MIHKKGIVPAFRKTVLCFYRKEGRTFPWRETRDPYAILVSEIMLQQTQVDRVIPKYLEWMKTFPTVEALAKASVGNMLKKWQGLGYNRRALNLKRATEKIVKECGGVFPKTVAEIDALPGVGPYTAGAIAAFAFDIPSAFIETNIRTVYLHFFFKGKREVRDGEILEVVEQTLPNKVQGSRGSTSFPLGGRTSKPCSVRDWYNALMDYGAMLKSTTGNPNIRSKHYTKQSAFKGSRREVRGMILKNAAEKEMVSVDEITSKKHSVPDIFAELVAEGFLRKQGSCFTLA